MAQATKSRSRSFSLFITLALLVGALQGTAPAQAADSLEIQPRSAWNARKPKRLIPWKMPIKYVVVHHFQNSVRGTPGKTHYSAIKQEQDLHMDVNGWRDLGYHFVIATDDKGRWQVYQGHPLTSMGTHAPSRKGNHQGIGVAFAGNFLDQDVPEEARKLFIRLVEKLNKDLDKHLEVIAHGYGKWRAMPKADYTDCPGEGGLRVVTEARDYFKQPL